MAALDDALILLDETRVIYEALPESSRRLVNQAVFLALTVRDPDNIQAKRTPLYEALRRLAKELQEPKTPEMGQKRPRTPQAKTVCPKTTPTPFQGAGFVHRANGGEIGTRCKPRDPDQNLGTASHGAEWKASQATRGRRH